MNLILHSHELPFEASVEFDKNEFINAFILANNMSFEDFDKDYIVEERPVEIFTTREQRSPILSTYEEVDTFRFKFQQEIIVRHKTAEEYQLALEVGNGNNVDRTDEMGADADLSSGRLAG